jgi:hypothetical protein
MTGYERHYKNLKEFEGEFEDLLHSGISLLGGTEELSLDQVKILRAFLAEGYASFLEKYAAKTKTPVMEWMETQASRLGVNQ